MGELIKLYREFFGGRWQEKKSGAVLTVVMALVGLWLSKEFFNGGLAARSVAALVFAAGTFTTWLVARRVPRAAGNAIGVIIGLACDNEDQSQQIKVDFADRIKSLLKESSIPFQVVVLPKRVLDNIEDATTATRLLNEARGHFGVFGLVRKRQEKGKDVYLLRLRHLVRHKAVPPEVGKNLAQEMTSLLPIDVMVAKENEASGFEFASQWMDLGTRFVVATAAMLSGDVKTAEQMLLELETQVKQNPSKAKAVEVAKRLRGRFVDLYSYWLQAILNFYRRNPTKEVLKQMDTVSDKLLARYRYHLNGLHVKAICDFKLRKDIRSARHLMNEARKLNKDVSWAYSLAFLSAYEGRLDEADTFYNIAFGGSTQDATVPIQCEEFINNVLNEEPDKAQLHYCLGLINHRAKQDKLGAKRDFNAFVAWDGSQKSPRQRGNAQQILIELG